MCIFSRSTRIIRNQRNPINILIEKGYYINSSINDINLKLVSFDWGGVLSVVKNNSVMREKIRGLLDAMQNAGIKMVIVSESDRELVLRALEEHGLKEYFYDEEQDSYEVYKALSPELASKLRQLHLTKTAILKSIMEQNNISIEPGFSSRHVIHFDDSSDYVDSFKGTGIYCVGVVGRVIKDEAYKGYAMDLINKFPVAIISHLGISQLTELLKITTETNIP